MIHLLKTDILKAKLTKISTILHDISGSDSGEATARNFFGWKSRLRMGALAFEVPGSNTRVFEPYFCPEL